MPNKSVFGINPDKHNRQMSSDNLNQTNKKGNNYNKTKENKGSKVNATLNITYETFQLAVTVKDQNYIQKKNLLKEYKEVLNKDLLKVINKEKEKEQARESSLQKIHNKGERQKMENIHNIERAKSLKLISTLNM